MCKDFDFQLISECIKYKKLCKINDKWGQNIYNIFYFCFLYKEVLLELKK